MRMNISEEVIQEINLIIGKKTELDLLKPISEQGLLDSLDYINLIVNLEEKYQIELFPLIIDNKDRPLSELIDLISGLVDNEENNENVEIR